MAIHENWVQNRQATAACDFCNRRNIPLQKCQACNINICKNCTSQGTLQKDPRHMLAREAADSFDWHQWGKEKTTTSIKKRKNASRIDSPESERVVETELPSKHSGEPGGYPAALSNLQYPQVPYTYPTPMIYNQQYNHGAPGMRPVGFPPHLTQYPHIPQYPYSTPPQGVYGFPSGQPIHYSVPQQPTYGLYPAQVPQLFSESPNSAVSPVPDGHERTLRRFRALSSEPEPANCSRTAGGQSDTEAPQAPQSPQAPPRKPVLPYRSLHAMHNRASLIQEQPSDRHKQIKHGEQMAHRQQRIFTLVDNPEELSVTRKKTHASSQSSDASEQAPRGSKRSREVAESPAKEGSVDLSNPDCRPTKKPRQEIIPRRSQQRLRPRPVARASKRTSLAFEEEEEEEEDEDKSVNPIVKTFRRGKTPQTRVVKVRMKSSAGVQRLREILGTPHAGNPKSTTTTQNILSSPPSSSHGQSTFSSQALKKARFDELLAPASFKTVPWPAELVYPVRDGERSHQYSAKTSEGGRQDSMAVLPTRSSHVCDQIDDDEARDAAMILLSMRHGH